MANAAATTRGFSRTTRHDYIVTHMVFWAFTCKLFSTTSGRWVRFRGGADIQTGIFAAVIASFNIKIRCKTKTDSVTRDSRFDVWHTVIGNPMLRSDITLWNRMTKRRLNCEHAFWKTKERTVCIRPRAEINMGHECRHECTYVRSTWVRVRGTQNRVPTPPVDLRSFSKFARRKNPERRVRVTPFRRRRLMDANAKTSRVYTMIIVVVYTFS